MTESNDKAAGLRSRAIAWRERHMSENMTVIVLAMLIGLLSGVGAWFLKMSIGGMCRFFLSYENLSHPNWYIAVLPAVGIFIAVAYQRKIVHSSLEHGTDIIDRAVAEHRYVIRASMCYQPIVASVLTLGFGGSAGAEGPVATVGSAIGSNIGRLFGVDQDTMRVLIGCGAGAGIAGIFKAPVGGALYTLEVMRMKMTTVTVIALLIASITGAMTCYMMTGFTFDVRFLPTSFLDPKYLPWAVALGIFCGLYSIYYIKITNVLHQFFKKISNVWLRALVSSSIVGVCLFMFPAMYGEGYGVVTDLMNDETLGFVKGGLFEDVPAEAWGYIGLGALLLLLKVFATISTNSGGGVAGDFAPTIFAGAFCGLLFAWVMNVLFKAGLPIDLFALFGAAGAFAGIIQAPLMAVFIISEMVGNGYGFFLPLCICAAFSALTVRMVRTRLDRIDEPEKLAAQRALASRAEEETATASSGNQNG